MKGKLRKIVASLTSVCVLIAPTLSYGGINSLLKNIVDSSYSQSPGLYTSPTTNTLSFGSYSFRMKNNTINAPLISFTPPHASISCAGADFNAGWLSVLNFNSFEHILSDAGKDLAWGIVLGLVYSLPGVADTFQKLNEWGRYFQNLTMDSCMTGLKLGKNIASSIWERNKTEAQDEAQLKGETASYEGTTNTYPKEMVDNGQYKKFFGDIPYGPLHEEAKELKLEAEDSTLSTSQRQKKQELAAELGNSKIDDLIASLFGVIDWKAIKGVQKGEKGKKGKKGSQGENLHICKEFDCLKAANIQVTYLPPRISSLDILMNGGTMKLYHCKWRKKQVTVTGTIKKYNGLSVQPETYEKKVTIHLCKDGITERKETIKKGLRALVEDKIKKIVDHINNGTLKIKANSLKSSNNKIQEEIAWIKSVPIPGFVDMLNYLAVLKERGFEAQYRNARYGLSELIAALMLKSMIIDAREALSSAWTYLANKNATEELNKEEANISKASYLLTQYINDNIEQNISLINTAEKTYQSLRAEAEHSFYKKFGESAQLFWNTGY